MTYRGSGTRPCHNDNRKAPVMIESLRAVTEVPAHGAGCTCISASRSQRRPGRRVWVDIRVAAPRPFCLLLRGRVMRPAHAWKKISGCTQHRERSREWAHVSNSLRAISQGPTRVSQPVFPFRTGFEKVALTSRSSIASWPPVFGALSYCIRSLTLALF